MKTYVETAAADLREMVERIPTDFPNYAAFDISLPAGHWRALIAYVADATQAERTANENTLVALRAASYGFPASKREPYMEALDDALDCIRSRTANGGCLACDAASTP